ncbi:ATP-binding cassette domain-containing protein [Robertkochia flava]|uniref:ATP-binding cassette domain-containing protein n=1 Tax=Robertkochia flava TaxID=3447986 RepID=UPI001CCC388C|nr:ATP-binding cassette domain-containing protein [Robertkochia marina]
MRIINAHQNNLKNIHLSLPGNQLIVVTGLSGSGKSSLAIDVIANEGYRHFLESLSAYNQQNAQLIPTAEVDEITELPPVIRIGQSKRFQSVNATFGTLSELTSVFRILFARFSGKGPLSKSLFSFNHPKGACETCHGIGQEEYIDLQKLIEDEDKTLREGAIATTLPNGYIVYSQVTVEELNKVCRAHGFSVDVPWKLLSAEQKDAVLYGSDRTKVYYGKHSIESRLKWKALKAKPREEGYYKGMLPIMQDILRRDRNPNILKFVSSRVCQDCNGARIKAAHLQYTWKGLNFGEWMDLSLGRLYEKLQGLDLTPPEQELVRTISDPLYDMVQLGMEQYSLGTPSIEISSGDGQRIKLIRQVNSSLQGIMYVFDEPSIGLPEAHQEYLRHIFDRLIARGNTVMVVEHDLNFIRSADWIVELGPEAGVHGGQVIFNGPVKDFLTAEDPASPTLSELRKPTSIPVHDPDSLSLDEFQPREGSLTVINRKTTRAMEAITEFCLQKNYSLIKVTDQPIGKTPRSNPATYTGLADKIRDLLAKSPEAKAKKLAKGAFSFNNKAGRCHTCEGAGVITLSMNIMGSVNQVCPECNGKRFKPEVLQVHWNRSNIAEIYNMDAEEAFDFFAGEEKITRVLALMLKLGLGYVKLGQPSNTLSGGEAQRIKLTKHFSKRSKDTVLLLEEPSIGLHQKNVRQLLQALHQLKGQTAGIICFENHTLFQSSCDALVENAVKAKFNRRDKVNSQETDQIIISGARTHYLKDLNLHIPKHQLSVISGISGSGKSSLLIDTLHGFGLQEMTKQFSTYQLSRSGANERFEVDLITGLTPTICVTRKVRSFSERSDMAMQTGIDRILRFAFSRKAQFEGEELSASHFSGNHELGKCMLCDGTGQEFLPDLQKIVLDETQSISEGLFEHNKALAYYGHRGSQYMAIAGETGKKYGFTLKTPFQALTQQQKDILLNGTGETIWETQWNFKTKTREGTQQVRMPWNGLFQYLREEYMNTRKNKNIENLKALFTPVRCRHCKGSGLDPGRLDFKLGGKSLHEIKSMNFTDLEDWLLERDAYDEVDKKLISNISAHLTHTIKRAKQLHIDHLQLHRRSNTLSGGECQRVELIKQLNSPLKGITYVLDEPSAGLSETNIPDLVNLLKELIEKGNTVIVIEHNKEIILAADHLIELGPKAGKSGGYITYQGIPKEYLKSPGCHPFLKMPSGKIHFDPGGKTIEIRNLSRHTLKKEVLYIPVGGITAISGKSGIGKTTLVRDVIIPAIRSSKPVHCESIDFPAKYTGVHYFEPKRLRAYKSTLLVSYLDLLKGICKVFAKETGLKPGDFSYKNKSAQCVSCKGKGYTETSLDIVAGMKETCEVCNGMRYQKSILEHTVGSKNIAEVLNLDISGLKKWIEHQRVSSGVALFLDQLEETGLGHLILDQPVRSLSSGEKQRLLLLNWLQDAGRNALYILDEPAIGLHYADIDLLFGMLEKISEHNDILVVDHNPYLLGKIGTGIILN